MTAVLEVSNLRKAFGGVIAVDGVSFEVRQGGKFGYTYCRLSIIDTDQRLKGGMGSGAGD